ncbi:type II toxin-antitoxin system toxin DNA ADP-ribosyl transferase DarT [Nocardia sp. NPDC004340]
MSRRPHPTQVYHITRIEHVPSMIEHGILSDTLATAKGLTNIQIGHQHIKEQRAARQVPAGPGGVVADYTPFYFAPRSPMLYAIHRNNVRSYTGGCDRIVYLVSTVQELRGRGLAVVGTDRHAVTRYTRFTCDDGQLTDFVDWPLMRQTYWNDVPEDPDRSERRQAELLVHQQVPWASILGIATKTEAVHTEVEGIIAAGGAQTPARVIPQWYF